MRPYLGPLENGDIADLQRVRALVSEYLFAATRALRNERLTASEVSAIYSDIPDLAVTVATLDRILLPDPPSEWP